LNLAGNLAKAEAHWVNRDTIAWRGADPSAAYRLYHSPAGGIQVETESGVQGGTFIPLIVVSVGPIKNTYGQIEIPETGSSSDNESLRDRTLSVTACLTCNYLRARPGRKRQLVQAAQHSVLPHRCCPTTSVMVQVSFGCEPLRARG
jgi:Pullulanase N2 domain